MDLTVDMYKSCAPKGFKWKGGNKLKGKTCFLRELRLVS